MLYSPHELTIACIESFSTDVVSITPIGSPIAGENYSLECSAGGSMATFEWLGPPVGRSPVANSSSVTVISDSNLLTSQLQFHPLQQTHNGSYLCCALIHGEKSNESSPPLELSVTGKLRFD